MPRNEFLTKFQSLKSSTGKWPSHQKVKIIQFPVSNNSISCLAIQPYFYNISAQKWAFDKIPKPKIIYLEMAMSLNGQNNFISCFNNSSSCLAIEHYYYYNISAQKWAFDIIPKPKIIYWKLAISWKGQKNSISCFNNSISCLAMQPY